VFDVIACYGMTSCVANDGITSHCQPRSPDNMACYDQSCKRFRFQHMKGMMRTVFLSVQRHERVLSRANTIRIIIFIYCQKNTRNFPIFLLDINRNMLSLLNKSPSRTMQTVLIVDMYPLFMERLCTFPFDMSFQ
jgi:hypothetical protein